MKTIKTAVAWLALALSPIAAYAATTITKSGPHTFKVTTEEAPEITVDFYGPNIFRIYQDPSGAPMHDPKANPPAQILVDNPRHDTGKIEVVSSGTAETIVTPDIELSFSNDKGTFSVKNRKSGETVIQSLSPAIFSEDKTTIRLKEKPGEYFYGGGVQNGRFSHKGKSIEIRNTNSWTDGGVASPTPYYWSTGGYGLMWYTFEPGVYDFGAAAPGTVDLSHNSPYLDMFVTVSPTPVDALNDFYQLTGNPVLLPKFGFYEGHLNAYNRDYWKEDEKGILFEDGKRYKESQKDNGGIHESLNGELPGNYQFSARAVVDRYAAHDMPLGWILPNDGYGAGYGQTKTLDGNIANLKQFGDYARSKGVEIGLWTQSDLHPIDSIEALLQRDIVKEVRDAGVRVLKTDVAWVGAGYSFGLNGVSDVGVIMPKYGDNARPFIISLDGWAGTQRYAGIWSGDQTGGEWEYIRFHIPTYIGSGLSGNPNITSDMDGIFGGKNLAVNVRDFQWKTFTPMQLNMDGWGSNPKYPMGVEGSEDINRAYLKLKSELMPYAYSIAREAVDGKPMIRAMFLEDPNDFTHGTATKYQFMYGPYFTVAPIYQTTIPSEDYSDYRNNIYLPEGVWYDYFTGKPYEGGKVWNYFKAPLWKLPVFVKADAIVPMTNPNNNPSQIDRHLRVYEFWPLANGKFTEYDDDGKTQEYLNGSFASTEITSSLEKGVLKVDIYPTKGSFKGFEPQKATELRINCAAAPKKVTVKVGGKKVKLAKASSEEAFRNGSDTYYYNPAPNRLKQWNISDASELNPQLWVKIASTDISQNDINVEVKGFTPVTLQEAAVSGETPQAPEIAMDLEKDVTPYSILLKWKPSANPTGCVEVEHDGMLYTNFDNTSLASCLLFEDLKPQTEYSFRLRSNDGGKVSEWKDIKFTTKDNPLEYAIRGISATSSAKDQEGFELYRLFDFQENGDVWHTDYGNREAVPFDIVMDLGSFNRLDRFEYLPRMNAGNGTILSGKVAYSENGKDWTEAGDFQWERNKDAKVFTFKGNPLARFIKIDVDKTVGGFGSGRELYVFKIPGSASYIPGDVNNDGKIDANDLTSYMNYTGLRKGDADYDYISMGDVNRNGLIDANDISYVATRLEGGVKNAETAPKPEGEITLTPDKRSYQAGETVKITVKGKRLKGVNALSLSLPYQVKDYEYIGIEPLAVEEMLNMTYDRLHTSGQKALYPTFVNLGDKGAIEGDRELFVIKMKAKKRGAFTPKASDVIIVGKNPDRSK